MDPSNPGMLPGTSSGYAAAVPHHPHEMVKVKKAKKHKKHHRHDGLDAESPAMSGGAAGAAAAAAGLKLKIKLGDESVSGGGSGMLFCM